MWPICASCRFFVLVVSGESPACCCLNGSPLISMKTRVHKVGKQKEAFPLWFRDMLYLSCTNRPGAILFAGFVFFPSLPGS